MTDLAHSVLLGKIALLWHVNDFRDRIHPDHMRLFARWLEDSARHESYLKRHMLESEHDMLRLDMDISALIAAFGFAMHGRGERIEVARAAVTALANNLGTAMGLAINMGAVPEDLFAETALRARKIALEVASTDRPEKLNG